MTKWMLASLALMASVVSGHARAGGCCAPPCPPTPCVTWVEKVVTCYRPEWRVREVPCVVNRPIFHEEMKTYTCTVMVPVWNEERRVCWICNMVPHQVQRTVTCSRMVPCCVTDPCTGCCQTVCKPETYAQTVTCTEWENVPIQKEFTVPVCSYRPEQRVFQMRHVVCEYHPETVVRRECYCVTVPYAVTIKVPVCLPVCCY